MKNVYERCIQEHMSRMSAYRRREKEQADDLEVASKLKGTPDEIETAKDIETMRKAARDLRDSEIEWMRTAKPGETSAGVSTTFVAGAGRVPLWAYQQYVNNNEARRRRSEYGIPSGRMSLQDLREIGSARNEQRLVDNGMISDDEKREWSEGRPVDPLHVSNMRARADMEVFGAMSRKRSG